jgi:hypothetical protein
MLQNNGAPNGGMDPSTGQFIDPLFAVIIAAALTETFIQWEKTNTYPDILKILIVVLGFINVLLSWYGYHKSVKRRPIRGVLRFAITIVLLPLYLLSILSALKVDYRETAWIYGVMFFLWSLWDYLKHIEEGEKKSFLSLQLRGFNIIAYSAVAVAYAAPLLSNLTSRYSLLVFTNEFSLFLTAFAVILLRIMKARTDPSSGITDIGEGFRQLLFGHKKASPPNGDSI